jgi:hypothetical protein
VALELIKEKLQDVLNLIRRAAVWKGGEIREVSQFTISGPTRKDYHLPECVLKP